VLKISAAQIDRLLSPHKGSYGGRGRSGTKPGGLLQTHIPIRTDNWDIKGPGFLEADTVAHCGGSLAGNFIHLASIPRSLLRLFRFGGNEKSVNTSGLAPGFFIWSVTYTDIWSGWTSNMAVWNKGAEGIVNATRVAFFPALPCGSSADHPPSTFNAQKNAAGAYLKVCVWVNPVTEVGQLARLTRTAPLHLLFSTKILGIRTQAPKLHHSLVAQVLQMLE